MAKRTQVQLIGAAAIAGGLLAATPASASSDMGCYFSVSLENATSTCSNTAAIAPGNDSRVNLNLLIRDARGLRPMPTSRPEPGPWSEFDSTHFGLDDIWQAYWPRKKDEGSRYGAFGGSRCQSLESGTAAFTSALEAAGGVLTSVQRSLIKGRDALGATCAADAEAGRAGLEFSVPSRGVANAFYRYLVASNAFYAGEWNLARRAYRSLTKSDDPWVRETALYMLGRVDINAAQDGAFGQWGDFLGAAKANTAEAERAGRLFDLYLSAYPDGRYAKSARGLKRRGMWLAGQRKALAQTYAEAMATLDPDSSDFSRMLDEIDNIVLRDSEMAAELVDPLFVATHDLMRMRRFPGSESDEGDDLISTAELAAQAPLFEGRRELFTFLQANHAYYVARDDGRVLELIPDAARQDRYDALAFSRQVLRGQALARRGDRNEAGFWRDLINGAEPVYQRPLAELGLALNYERNEELDKVFAAGSPITDSFIRMTLLRDSAGPEILRATVRDATLPASERRTALRALLWKDLSRGHYAEFVADHELLQGFAKDAPFDEETYTGERYPLDEFRSGVWSEEYECPAIVKTAATLARNPGDVHAMLCLGDFYRLNGFVMDAGRYEYSPPGAPRELGDGPDAFPGALIPRQALYQQVIADRSAKPADRAYALYRAVRCYAPTGSNDCGGKGVAQSQRKAWFHELKTRYSDSRWARELKYYW